MRLIVLPTQRATDAIAWGAKAGEPRVVFALFDSSLESAVREKGVTSWVMASDLARTARRNPMYATNPADIRAGDAVRFLDRQRDENIPEPVASQLRSLCADSCRGTIRGGERTGDRSSRCAHGHPRRPGFASRLHWRHHRR
jgi:hypothetical protein